jgi:hypothetical protein
MDDRSRWTPATHNGIHENEDTFAFGGENGKNVCVTIGKGIPEINFIKETFFYCQSAVSLTLY